MRPLLATSREGTFLCALVALALASGCTYDFDSLSSGTSTTPPVADMMVTGDMISPDPDMDTPDPDMDAPDPDMTVTPDMDTPDPDMGGEMDMGPEPLDVAIGASCSADTDCGNQGARCFQGYCTYDCDEDLPCPEGSACRGVGYEERVCLAECEEGDACDIEGRADLSCVLGAEPNAFDITAQTYRACEADEDADGLPDREDNCPADRNPDQSDLDADGIGDACDEEPLCHPSMRDGRVEYGEVDWDLVDFGTSSIIDGALLPLLGGQKEDTFSARRAVLDRHAATWRMLPDNLYPAIDFATATTRTGEIITTPGRAPGDEEQVGRVLRMAPTGEIAQGGAFTERVYEPLIATTGHGILYMFGYRDPDPSSTSVGIWRYDPSSERFILQNNTSAGRTHARWYAGRREGGALIFYSSPQESTDPANPQPPISRVFEIDVRSGSVATRDVELPVPDAQLGALDPLFLETPGGLSIMYDRKRGLAYKLEVDELGRTAPSRLPELDISITVGSPRFIPVGNATSFILLGQRPDDPTKLIATEHNLACNPNVGDFDADQDGVSDFVDNCVGAANANQANADGDARGDECDLDDDNDGISDVGDVVVDDMGVETSFARDSDDDGTDNELDQDADNDGIVDASDRFPLDTNNNGLPNLWDTDDDSDGYSDSQERSARTNPYAPLSFPNSGRILWVREEGGARVVEWANLDEMAMAQAVVFPDGANPHLPRFSQTGNSVVALDGEPGASSALLWSRIETPGQQMSDPGAMRQEAGVTLRGVTTRATIMDPVVGEVPLEYIASHERAGVPGRWDISTMSATADMITGLPTLTALVTRYPETRAPYLDGSSLYFLGAPTGCELCMTVYRTTLTPDATPSVRLQGLLDLRSVIYNGDSFGTVGAKMEGGEATTGYLDSVELMPPGAVAVNTVAGMSESGHAVVSARSQDGSYALWFFNGRNGVWYELRNGSGDLIELDWKK